MDSSCAQRGFSTTLSDIVEVLFLQLHNQTNSKQKAHECQQEPPNTNSHSTAATIPSFYTHSTSSSLSQDPFGHLTREILKLTEQSSNYSNNWASELDPSKFNPSTMEVPIVYNA